jgi:hypothetical protein
VAEVDPVTLEIANHRLAAIAEEMGVVLGRTALSPNIKERRDYSCAVFDAGGALVAQAAHIPVHLGSTPLSVRAAIEKVTMGPGDVVMLNDPFAGGTHLPDVTVVAPVFRPGDRRPIGFVANRAHHADIGGMDPGSMPLADEIFQEGVRIPPIADRKLAELAYQTVNTRGRSLATGDVIKGHVIQVVGAASSQHASEAAAAWDKLKGQAGGHFENFLRAVDFIMFGRHRDNDFGEQLMERCDAPDGAAFAHAWVTQDLPKHLENFLPLIAHERAQQANGLDISFRQLSFLGWREWQGAAIELVNAYRKDERKLARAMMQLQRACYIMHLLKWADRPNSRAKALSNAINELHQGRSPFRSPNQSGRGALYFGADHKAQARGALMAPMPEDSFHGPIVRWLETLHWSENLPKRATDDRSVEHVLPRTHGDDWVAAFPSEAEREKLKNMLGNFCLLPRELDRSLGNTGFAEKKLSRPGRSSTRSGACWANQRPHSHDSSGTCRR